MDRLEYSQPGRKDLLSGYDLYNAVFAVIDSAIIAAIDIASMMTIQFNESA